MKKHFKITETDIKNINDDYFFIIAPMWEKGNIYDSYDVLNKSLMDFSLSQKYFYAIEWLIAEVFNGGFYQFFDNSTGIVWEDARKGFEMMKFDKMLAIMDNVQKIYGKQPSKVREERWKEIEKFHDDEMAEALDGLDGDFYEIEDELYQNIVGYIKMHPADFIFDGEIDVQE